ncbi:DUF4276 family protein [Mucilaginibacter gotjawali]|uniref:DUF4276 family protein n=2 Tax=Mucilaginibacter gotjawali TaxID=1550579 RepID=A0A839SFL0_9SPHI|nr:DUF4276 family protein [Mucilaginibacter gotjawali]MBB3055327.1 hypothetical protein [Mucilaginibacter gotjawali]
MKRVIIICEGETEREFCKHILAPYFAKKEIFIQSPLIKRSMGGIVKWNTLKKEIHTYLQEDDVLVTMLIDYYGLYNKYAFPSWEDGEKIVDKNTRMDFLEAAMKQDLRDAVQHRFLPYLQLHEFEGLLFNDIQIFYEQVPKNELVGKSELIKTFQDYDNPEMINNNKNTSPSHRLKRIIEGYNKILYGHYFAEAIGLDKIRNKSPRFNNWLNAIEKL